MKAAVKHLTEEILLFQWVAALEACWGGASSESDFSYMVFNLHYI